MIKNEVREGGRGREREREREKREREEREREREREREPLSFQAPGATGSGLELVGPVSQYCDCVRQQV